LDVDTDQASRQGSADSPKRRGHRQVTGTFPSTVSASGRTCEPDAAKCEPRLRRRAAVPLITSRIALAAQETGGTIGIVENLVRPGWPGPPLHHHAFDETFCILEGELTFQLGADRLVGRPGDTLFVVRGVHHTLANLSGSPARYLLVCTPGGFEQRFGPEAESAPSGPNTDVIVVGPRIAEMDAER